jgi:hypothetical protein
MPQACVSVYSHKVGRTTAETVPRDAGGHAKLPKSWTGCEARPLVGPDLHMASYTDSASTTLPRARAAFTSPRHSSYGQRLSHII